MSYSSWCGRSVGWLKRNWRIQIHQIPPEYSKRIKLTENFCCWRFFYWFLFLFLFRFPFLFLECPQEFDSADFASALLLIIGGSRTKDNTYIWVTNTTATSLVFKVKTNSKTDTTTISNILKAVTDWSALVSLLRFLELFFLCLFHFFFLRDLSTVIFTNILFSLNFWSATSSWVTRR